MVRNLARGVFQYPQPPRIISYASTVGQKEGDGPMGSCFDCVEPDAHFGQETWEQAESVMQRRTVQLALEKSGLRDSDLSCICAGDLMNQCIGSTYGMRPLEIPLLGIYGACSTMAEGLLTASFLAAGGVGEYTAAVTSSHFSTAERQFRFPLSYGGQRPPTAQWTCTGSGAVIFQQPDGVPDGVCVTGACIGIMVDLGVTDANHMGAAMAPAAADTIVRYLKATQTAPEQYDAIVTGDLGIVGSELLCDLVMKQGFDITRNHKDCGAMLYDPETQDTHAGGSGCGCSASLLCGHFLPALQAGDDEADPVRRNRCAHVPHGIPAGREHPRASPTWWNSHGCTGRKMRDGSAFFVWQKYCLVIREKQHRRGEHGSPGTPPSSLRLATSSMRGGFEKNVYPYSNYRRRYLNMALDLSVGIPGRRCALRRGSGADRLHQAHPGTHPHRIRGGWRGAVGRGALSLGWWNSPAAAQAFRSPDSGICLAEGVRESVDEKGLSGHLHGRTHRILCRHYGGDGVRGRLCRSLSPQSKNKRRPA